MSRIFNNLVRKITIITLQKRLLVQIVDKNIWFALYIFTELVLIKIFFLKKLLQIDSEDGKMFKLGIFYFYIYYLAKAKPFVKILNRR